MDKPQTSGFSWGRVRVPLTFAAFVFFVANTVLDLLPVWVGVAVFVAAMAVYLRVGSPRTRRPVRIVPPVAGRWRALNSPADHVPSHGLNAYGQTWAIDLVSEPDDESRPAMGWWPLALPPERFPGFGEEILAPAEATVVHTHDRARDHWSRNSWPGFVVLLAEGARELAGPSWILGNHVVLELGDGVYAALAHLQRGSIRVRPGDRVGAGEPIARCGNSGTSSEPHLHFQLMDHPRVALADGIPFAFEFRSNGRVESGAPGKAEAFVA